MAVTKICDVCTCRVCCSMTSCELLEVFVFFLRAGIFSASQRQRHLLTFDLARQQRQQSSSSTGQVAQATTVPRSTGAWGATLSLLLPATRALPS